MSNPAFTNEGPNDSASEYNTAVFIINSILAKMQTATLVKVIKCTNSGGLSAVGTVDVQVLVNLQTAVGVAITHDIIYGLPYFRIQGGSNAIILDPQPGDIGAAVFCSRDISSVVNAKGFANPGSNRKFDWADGLYFGGMLNGVPTQYVQFTDAGINVVSPTKVTVQAPEIDLDAETLLNITAPLTTISGELVVAGSVTFDSTVGGTGGTGDVTFAGDVKGHGGTISLDGHKHPVVGIETGTSTVDTGTPI